MERGKFKEKKKYRSSPCLRSAHGICVAASYWVSPIERASAKRHRQTLIGSAMRASYRSLRLINVNKLYLWLRVHITQIPIRHVLIRITYHHVHRVTQSLFCTFGTNKFHRTQDVFMFTALDDCIADNAVIGIQEHQDEGQLKP